VLRATCRQGVLEAGDIEEALQAATAIGDDKIQRQTTGYVVPDSFTHGSVRTAPALVQTRLRHSATCARATLQRRAICDRGLQLIITNPSAELTTTHNLYGWRTV
jgi:hypothetical protein